MNSHETPSQMRARSGKHPDTERTQQNSTVKTDARSDAAARPPSRDLLVTIGEIFFLLSHSELHMRQPLFLIQRRFVHPLSIGQARMFYGTGNVPIGYVSWAWLSDDVDRAMMDDPDALRPGDWQSGDHLWFIEFIAPFGRVREMVRFLDDEVFGTVERPVPGRAKSYKIDPKRGEPKLRYLYPRRVKTEPKGVLS